MIWYHYKAIANNADSNPATVKPVFAPENKLPDAAPVLIGAEESVDDGEGNVPEEPASVDPEPEASVPEPEPEPVP